MNTGWESELQDRFLTREEWVKAIIQMAIECVPGIALEESLEFPHELFLHFNPLDSGVI